MADPRDQVTRAVVAVISGLGFVGNSHYCPDCGNTFHGDGGQHEETCSAHLVFADEVDDWWGDVERRLAKIREGDGEMADDERVQMLHAELTDMRHRVEELVGLTGINLYVSDSLMQRIERCIEICTKAKP